MAVFTYKAETTEAAMVRGTLVADSPRHARDLLRESGLSVRAIGESNSGGHGSWRRILIRRGHRRAAIDLARELSTLLGAGIPLLEALDVVLRESHRGERLRGGMRSTVMRMRDRVASGAALAEAMRESEAGAFDELAIGLVETGEASGSLDQTLARWAVYAGRIDRLQQRLTNALIYPCIVVTTAITITLLLMTLVIPNVLQPLIQAGKPLPLITQVVKGGSDFLIQWWWAIASIGLACAVTAVLAMRTHRGRLAVDHSLLRIPVIRDLVRKAMLVRFSVVVSILLESGVSFVDALRLTKRAVRNRVMQRAIDDCIGHVESGRDIADALEEHESLFPATVSKLVAVGQQTGELARMLARLADEYDHAVESAWQRALALLEPLVILILALLVGSIAFATILPILEAGRVL